MQGGPGASALPMKRCDLFGFLLASLCSLFSPSRLELRGLRGAVALAAQPRSAADTKGRGRQGALRTGGAGCPARQCHCCNPIAAGGVAAAPRAAALRRPPEPRVHAHRDAEGPRGGRAPRTAEVPGHFSRSHWAAGRQVGWADGMLRHSEPASGQSAPENPHGVFQTS